MGKQWKRFYQNLRSPMKRLGLNRQIYYKHKMEGKVIFKVLNFYIQMHKLIRKLAEQKTNNDDFTIGSELLHENINENIDMGKEHLDNLKKSLKILASKNNSLPGKFSIKKLRPLHASVFLAQKFLLFLQYYKKEGSKNLYR